MLIEELRVLKNLLRNRLYVSKRTEDTIIRDFHKLYYQSASYDGTWYDTRWRGVQTLKCPLDLWLYQEIIHEKRPDIIIETGTFMGGSALFMADVCESIGNGRIISIDIEYQCRPKHHRIEYIKGSSTQVDIDIPKGSKVMVILDSDHKKSHVIDELNRFSRLVTKNQYMIVEDTNVNGHPVLLDHGDGPMEAVDEFIKGSGFRIDVSKHKFLLTFNPYGFLLKTRD